MSLKLFVKEFTKKTKKKTLSNQAKRPFSGFFTSNDKSNNLKLKNTINSLFFPLVKDSKVKPS